MNTLSINQNLSQMTQLSLFDNSHPYGNSEILNQYCELKYHIDMYLPLLQILNRKEKWQLWLLPEVKVSRDTLKDSGLSINKIVQLPFISINRYLDVVKKALLTNNFSYILLMDLGFNHQTLSHLQKLAIKNKTPLFIIKAESLFQYKNINLLH